MACQVRAGASMSETTVQLQGCLDRLRAGDESARAELVNAACERLARLTRKMLYADGRLRRWEESSDVFQNAMIRLCRALESTTPQSLREFFRLAAMQIRRELIDLARHHYGPAGAAANHDSRPPGQEPADSGDEPARLMAWGEFHEAIGALPDEERDVFDLLWYQGLTREEAAALLEVSAKTVQRRWQAACLRLHDALHGELPGL
jgi:RNA polymerase sigma factor (sigma-70 family)